MWILILGWEKLSELRCIPLEKKKHRLLFEFGIELDSMPAMHTIQILILKQKHNIMQDKKASKRYAFP